MNARPLSAAHKRPINISVSTELLNKARELGINLSQTLEQRLVELVREAEAQTWLEKNRGAIDAFNKRVKRDGIWSDGLRNY